MSDEESPATYFLPPERALPEELMAARAEFLSNRVAVTLLEGIPELAMVLNRQRQIVACNTRLLQALGVADPKALLGLRPGEAAECVHADDGPGGCGTGVYCIVCGAANAIRESLDQECSAARECRLRVKGAEDGGALDLDVQATFVNVGEEDYVVVVLRDISSEKRRRVLERVFFHDVLNTAGGIQAIAWLLRDGGEDAETELEYKSDLVQLSHQIADEIAAQRQLSAAENGELQLNLEEVPIAEMLEGVLAFYRHHDLAHSRTLMLVGDASGHLITDSTLLRRTLGNLVKNALEATPEGGTVSVGAREGDGEVVLFVHNPTVMPEAVQRQIFQRSFSTKGGQGRGIGTHSVKLFVERYLGGRVDFVSCEPDGTTFFLRLPVPATASG